MEYEDIRIRTSWRGGRLITRRVAYNNLGVDQVPIEEDVGRVVVCVRVGTLVRRSVC